MHARANRLQVCLFTAAILAVAAPALAERADRQQPVNLEADKVTVDDKQQSQLFEGSVHLTQGSLEMRSARFLVIQDAAGFQKGVAYGDATKQAWFKQKREARDDYVEGKADRIEHDSNNEITEFFGNAWVRNGADEVSGPYIRYDGKSDRYVVNNQTASGETANAGATGGRVRAVIQPKGENAPKADAPKGDAPKADAPKADAPKAAIDVPTQSPRPH